MPVQSEESIDLLTKDSGLKGNLALTNITDLLQFLSSSAKSGMIRLVGHPGGEEGNIHFVGGELVSAVSKNVTGLEGLCRFAFLGSGHLPFYSRGGCTKDKYWIISTTRHNGSGCTVG